MSVDNKILLVPHKKSDNNVVWYLPGGKIDCCEPTTKALEREILEETGYKIVDFKLIDIVDSIISDEPWHSITILYSIIKFSGELKSETHEKYGLLTPQWFDVKSLPNIVNYLQPSIEKYFINQMKND